MELNIAVSKTWVFPSSVAKPAPVNMIERCHMLMSQEKKNPAKAAQGIYFEGRRSDFRRSAVIRKSIIPPITILQKATAVSPIPPEVPTFFTNIAENPRQTAPKINNTRGLLFALENIRRSIATRIKK